MSCCQTFLLLPPFPYQSPLGACGHVLSRCSAARNRNQQFSVEFFQARLFNGWHQVLWASFSWCSCFHIHNQSSDRLLVLLLVERVEPLLSGHQSSGPLGFWGAPGAVLGSGVLGEPQLVAPGTPHANTMQIQTRARTTALNSATFKHTSFSWNKIILVESNMGTGTIQACENSNVQECVIVKDWWGQ